MSYESNIMLIYVKIYASIIYLLQLKLEDLQEAL